MKQILRLLLFACFFCFGNQIFGQDCEIEVIVFETSSCEDGTYLAELVYNISNTESDSVDIWINNVFIGQYEISNDAIVIEDIVSNNEDIGTLLICANNDTECCFVYTFEQPVCEEEGECEIGVELEWSDCDENGTYTLVIHYEVINPGNDLLDLWVNNEFAGNFEVGPNGAGTITIDGVTPREFSDYDIVVLCVNDNEDCCFEEEFMPPCGNEEEDDDECEIVVELELGDCNENGMYDLFVHYEVSNPTDDALDLWVNTDYVGSFEIDPSGSGTIIVEDVTPTENYIYDLVELCVNDNENCCWLIEYLHPCGNEEEGECQIGFELEWSDCGEDGTYTLFIHYTVENPDNVYLDLWVNSEYEGIHNIDPSNSGTIIIDGVTPREFSDYDIVELCVNDNPDCCYLQEFMPPCENEEEECEISIEVETSECIDGVYDLTIFYSISGNNDNTLTLIVNDITIGEFEIDPSGEGTITLDDISPVPGVFEDYVTICINDQTCCYEHFFDSPCEEEGECDVTFILDWTDCMNGTYDLYINYTIENATDDLMDLWVNNEYEGVYEIDPSGGGVILIENVTPSETSDYDIVVLCINDNENCCHEEAFIPPCENEEGECEIGFELEWSDCGEDGTYTLFIHYEVVNPGNVYLDLWVNNEYEGIHNIDPSNSGTIIIDGVTPREFSDYDIVELCVNDNPDCCYIEEFIPPCENEESCSISIEVDVLECIDGVYTLVVYYEINGSDDEVFDLYINGNLMGEFELDPSGNGAITFEGVEPMNGTDFDVVTICTNDSQCCLEFEYTQPECEDEAECSVEFEVSYPDCIEGGTFELEIEYNVSGTTEELVDVWINGDLYGSYEIDPSGSGVLLLEQVVPDPNSILIIVDICVNDLPDCCHTVEFELEECGGIQDDIPPYQLFNENGTSNILLTTLPNVELNYQVYSSSGQLINYKNNVSGTDQIEIGIKGIYLIRIEANRNVFYHKMLSIQ